MKNFEKHFWNHSNELIDLDYIMKWLDAEQLCDDYRAYYTQCLYIDTAAVTSCSRRSQYVELWIATNWIKFSPSPYSYSNTAPTALGIYIEQIRANVFY